MLKNSRVTGTLDTARVGQALARPGLDTRTWVSLAVVNKQVVDLQEGVFADVTLVPSMVKTTARVAVEYAGDGFGVYAPLQVDDEVIVEAPSGDPDNGLVLTRRLYSRSDPPPADAASHPDDLLIFVRPGRSLRLISDGGGNLVVEARGSGSVLLGAESASRGVARLNDVISISGGDLIQLQANLDGRYAIANPLTLLGPVTGSITSASNKVKST